MCLVKLTLNGIPGGAEGKGRVKQPSDALAEESDKTDANGVECIIFCAPRG